MIQQRGARRRMQWVVWVSLSTAVLFAALLLTGCALFSVNRSPIARMIATPASGESPLPVQFDASGSSDPDGTIESYHWDFGDGSSGSGIMAQHTYVNTSTTTRRYTATLTVTDDKFATARAQQSIEVRPSTGTGGEPGDPVAVISVDRIAGLAPFSVTFDGTQSEGGDGTIVAYNWEFGDGRTSTGSRVSHTYIPEATTEYVVTLFVWTGGGAVSTAEITIVAIVPVDTATGERPHAEVSVSEPLLLHDATTSPIDAPTLYQMTFDPRGSYSDAGHRILYYIWSFGDGSEWVIRTNNNPVTHVYALARGTPSRTFVVRLFVYDDQGLEDMLTRNLTLTQPEPT